MRNIDDAVQHLGNKAHTAPAYTVTMLIADIFTLPARLEFPAVRHARRWWKQLEPHRQDWVAMLAPLAAVALFMAAIVAALGYLQIEEMVREQEAVQRDVEYTQQRLRLRLLERQGQLSRIAREIGDQEINAEEFRTRITALLNQYPELQGAAWLDERKRVQASAGSTATWMFQNAPKGGLTLQAEGEAGLKRARYMQQAVYVQRTKDGDYAPLLQLFIPLTNQGRFTGVLLAEFSIDGLYRYSVPSEVSARYAVSLQDAKGAVLAGVGSPLEADIAQMPWRRKAHTYSMPLSPVGADLVLRAQAYRASPGLIGSGLFWLVSTLSLMTTWMLVANWRHSRKRLQAQQALMSETNFRRAMENSMLTGMRAMDLQGRITYVNAAFCMMTGWSESQLVGRTAPFPYWPESDREQLTALLDQELAGKTNQGGIQVRVKRRDGVLFDARLYVAPLIDAMGAQTGWVTSMTDITEPNRVREQLSASHLRFTTVLEALDASISVAPLGSDELVFANKLYRQWFDTQAGGHLQLVAEAGMPQTKTNRDAPDDVDLFAGFPLGDLPEKDSESAELYIASLGKWLEVRTRYLSWVDGRLAQMVIATDITGRRLAEEQAAMQAKKAQTASRMITMGEMASSVAHELNQPLTAINNYCNGMVSRIKDQQISPAELLGAIEKTAKQAQRAGQIIQRIRSFVKRSEPNRTESDVETMVGESLELVEIELRRFNVRLVRHIADDLPPLVVDRILIEQVLVNLLRNAAESIDAAQRLTPERSVELRVTRSIHEGKEGVEFSVQDSGNGIAPEVMARLYEAFYSTKADGMGIGLSLCRSIVESHRGRMAAENLYNGSAVSGCKFLFWLPLA